MAQPVAYTITTDFSTEEANGVSGRSTVRTDALDAEFTNIATTIAAIRVNLAILQRDDTALKDGLVRVHTLAADVLDLIGSAGFSIHSPLGWVTATAYTVGQIVTNGTGTYVCAVAHTAGTFATDLAAGKWATIFDTATFTAANLTFAPAGTIAAANVQAAVEEAASEALQKSANLSDVASAATSRTNLGVVAKAGDTMTGALVLASDPKADLEPVALRDLGGYLFGLTLSNSAGDPTNDIDIAAGVAVNREDGTASYLMRLAAGLTKQLDAAWAVGTNAGMRATGVAIANTTYHIFKIVRPDTGVVDIAADTSATGANITANTNAAYTKWRRIGSIVRLAGAIVAFKQHEDRFLFDVTINEFNANNPGTAAVLRTLSIPVGVKCGALMTLQLTDVSSAGSIAAYITDPDQSDSAADTNRDHLATVSAGTGDVRSAEVYGTFWTDTSARIRTRLSASDADITLTCRTHGWIDTRGRGA